MLAHLPISRSEGVFTRDSGGLRWSMPAAVGVALANPGERLNALIGVGPSRHSIQAVWTAAPLKLPITFVILNNQRYAALQDFAPVFGFAATDAVQGTDQPGLDFVAIAQGQGCAARRATDPAQLHAALSWPPGELGTTLVEVEVA